MFKTITAACVLMLVASGVAAQTLTVEGLVSPAWVERGGAREPLMAGMALAGKDRVHTGARGRALLRMTDGSAVKLGENAVLAIEQLEEKKGADTRRLLSAALDVARGAFRFTTGVFGKPRGGREVKIRIAAVTAGIRGTDVWGKSEAERDVVCLIEGRIEVEHGGREFTMQEPLSFFVAPRKEKPLPIAPVSKEQLDLWAEETEIRAGNGAVRRDGRHGVEVTSARDQGSAEQTRNKLRVAGFPAEIETVRDSYGGEEYRVRIGRLGGAKDAQALVARLKALGFADARTSR